MATPTKLSVFEIDPSTLDREKIATFTMKDGKVEAKYFGGKQQKALASQLVDTENKKTVTPEDGERFMELLGPAFAMSSFIAVEEGE